jgi:hypothetical protein
MLRDGRLTPQTPQLMQKPVHEKRAEYSRGRLTDLRKELGGLPGLADFRDLTIFGAGSYARLEASKYSDIDMFFLSKVARSDVEDPHTKSLRLFGRVIEIVDKMKFPKFSNDCEYLVLLNTPDILSNLGTRSDDHANYFTARMLLLLEGHCLYGDTVYREITTQIVHSYFVDFRDHQQTFQPMFLVNDICRFWKTLLLNYESRRNLADIDGKRSEEKKRKQRVRNFKLKFSRMTTCFATIAALGSFDTPVDEKTVIELTQFTPRARLASIGDRIPRLSPMIDDILDRYDWFLKMTGVPTPQLESHFKYKKDRTEMFKKATAYGDLIFALLQALDSNRPDLRLIRTLVI